MNNNLRKILTIAVCLTAFAHTNTTAYGGDVTISSGIASAVGETGTLSLMGLKHYTWQKGAEDSVSVNLISGGDLRISGYSDSVINDTIKATSGDLTLTNGILTIDDTSSISGNVALTVNAGSWISITGGSVDITQEDSISGSVNIFSGNLNLYDTDITNEGINIVGGTVYSGNSYINSTNVSGGTAVLENNNIENYNQSGGSVTINGGSVNLNNSWENVTGGVLNLGTTSSTTMQVGAGQISTNAEININRNATIDITGGDVALDSNDTWNGNVNISSGNLALVGIDKKTNATFTQTGGTTLIEGETPFYLNNSSDKISGGTLDIGSDTTEGTINVTKGTITGDTTVNIYENSVLEVRGSGNVTLDSNDYISGIVGVTGGSLNLNNANKNSEAVFIQQSGTTNITGKFDLNNSLDYIENGTVNIGSDTASGTLNINKATIESDAQINLAQNSSLNLKNGEVSLGADDTWAGNVETNGGTLNIDNATKTGTLTVNNGTINITGKKFDLNNNDDYIDGGTLNIGNGETSARLNVSNGTITQDAIVNINEKATLNITGGDVKLDTDTNWAGNVNISSGSLALVGINKTGTFTQDGGSTTITGRNFDLNNENDYIAGGNLTIGNGASASKLNVSQGAITKDTTVNITNNATINVNGGSVELGQTSTWNGNVEITDGYLTVNSVTKNPTGTFTQTGGKTTIIGEGFDLDNSEDIVSGGTLNVGNKTTSTTMTVSQGTIASEATVNINKNAKLNIAGGDVSLESDDSWAGDVNISEGELAINNIQKNSSGKFTQTGGTTTITDTEFDLNNSSDNINGGKLNIQNSTLNITEGNLGSGAKVNLSSKSTINVDGGNAVLDNSDTWAGAVNVTDGQLTIDGVIDKSGTLNQTKGTTTVTSIGFDLNNASDKISGGTLNVGDGSTVSEMSVSQGTISKNTTVNINTQGTLNVNGGTVDLNKNGVWTGDVNMSEGTLNIAGKNKDTSGKFIQTGGTTTVTDTGFNLNNASDNVAYGIFNIGSDTAAGNLDVSQGTISQNASVNLNKASSLNIKGGDVTLDGETDTYNGTINVSGGSLALVGINKDSSAVLKQTGGTTTVNGTFDLNNSSDNLDGGVLNLGVNSDPGILTVSKGTIGKNTAVNISTESQIDITGGKVTLNDNDNWEGNINHSSGNLNLAGITKNSSGVLTQTGGTTTVTNTNTLNNDNDTISAGNLIIGTSSENGILNLEKGTIDKNAAVTINETGTLNVKGGIATLDGSNDTVNGNINVSNGTLNLNNDFTKTTTSSSKFNQSGGTTNIDDAKLALNTSASKITGGTVNISQTGELDINNKSKNSSVLNSTGGKVSIQNGSTYTTTGGTVNEASEVTVAQGATLELNGNDANVTLDGSNDTFDGHAKLTNGTLNLKNGLEKTTSTNGTYNQTDGTANISGSSKLTLNEIGSVISGGEVNVTEDSELTVNNGKSHKSRINVSGSNFGIKNNSTYTTTGGTIDKDSQVTIEAASKLKINGDDAEVNLNGANDKFDGSVELTSGKLYISDDLTKVTDASGNYLQTGGSMTLKSAKLTLNDAESKISGGDVNLTENSALTVTNQGADITGGNIVIDDSSVLNYLAQKGLIQYSDGNQINIDTSGLINMANNVRTNSQINNLTINNLTGDGQAEFMIDIHARSNGNASSDTISANSIKVAQASENGTIRISDYNLNGDIFGYDAPIDKHIRLGKIFKTDDLGQEVNFSATDKEIFTPIGYYRLNASSANDGSYTFDLTRFNPQVFRGQVATAASYMNQLVVNDTLFNRAQIRRYGASYDELFKNKTAILDVTASYERTLKEGGLWTEMFGNFETLKMSQGLNKVRNNSWGFIVGADFGLRELKNGWKWMPTAYIAYNGGHQTFNKVGMYENGGQIGFMNSFSKENFMETALVYGGLYGTSMDVGGNSEDAFNYFFGLASKSAYDFNLGSHFKVQPSLTLAYNMFGQQNWHSDYGQMGMMSGFLNGFNVAPGVNFIWQQESWNLYATLAYAWNFFGGIDGQAGNVDLPSLKMKQGYLTWGFGMSKSFSDRLMMYAQATVRNIGRTGIICQGGLNWRL